MNQQEREMLALLRDTRKLVSRLETKEYLTPSYLGSIVPRIEGTPLGSAIAYWTGAGTVAGGSIQYNHASGTPTLRAAGSLGYRLEDDGGNLALALIDGGFIGIGTGSSLVTADGSSTAALRVVTSLPFPFSLDGSGAFAGLDINGVGVSSVPFIQLNRGTVRGLSITVQTDNNTVNFRNGNAAGTAMLTFLKSNNYMGAGTVVPAAQFHAHQPTLGSAVYRYSSTATNDDPAEELSQNRVATTDNTQTTLHNIPIASATANMIEAIVVARRTGGTGGTANDSAAYVLRALVKDVSGTATLVGAVDAGFVREDQAGWDATIDVTAGTARVRVTGATNNNVTWHLSALRVRSVGT